MVDTKFIIALNDKAASCLARRNCRKACKMLLEALKITRDLLPNNIITAPSVPSKRLPTNMSRKCHSSLVPLTIAYAGEPTTNGFALFNNAFLVRNNNLDLNQLSIVLLYNLALCYHIDGNMRCGSANLDKALETYKIISSILKDKNNTNDQSIDELFLLVLAVQNNTGNIHANFFHIQETKECAEIIHSLLDKLSDTDLMQETLQFFHTFLVFPTDKSVCALAPAA